MYSEMDEYNAYQQGFNERGHGGTVSRMDIIHYLSNYFCASEVVLVDEFETRMARHICQGTNIIQLLKVFVFYVPTVKGIVPVEIVYCNYCRKLIINKNSIELL